MITTNNKPYGISRLQSYRQYRIRIRAYTDIGAGEWSDAIVVFTGKPQQDVFLCKCCFYRKKKNQKQKTVFKEFVRLKICAALSEMESRIQPSGSKTQNKSEAKAKDSPSKDRPSQGQG